MNKIFLATLAIATLALAGCTQPVAEQAELSNAAPQLIFAEESFDFGILRQSGGIVTHDFSFTYAGSEAIQIIGTPASCACTSATIDKQRYQPGESGVLTVAFDPNLHAEPAGRFFKTVAVLTEPAITPTPEIKIWAEIDLDLGEAFYKLKEEHID